jgi:hypothetical protein
MAGWATGNARAFASALGAERRRVNLLGTQTKERGAHDPHRRRKQTAGEDHGAHELKAAKRRGKARRNGGYVRSPQPPRRRRRRRDSRKSFQLDRTAWICHAMRSRSEKLLHSGRVCGPEVHIRKKSPVAQSFRCLLDVPLGFSHARLMSTSDTGVSP